VYPAVVQRFCNGCRRYHELDAFDLDSEGGRGFCRAFALSRARTFKAGERRARRSKIEALEQQRRKLIASLVKIDQEIDKERTFQAIQAPSKGAGDVDEAFSPESDLDPGD